MSYAIADDTVGLGDRDFGGGSATGEPERAASENCEENEETSEPTKHMGD